MCVRVCGVERCPPHATRTRPSTHTHSYPLPLLDCSLCDDEQQNFLGCSAYQQPAPNGGICGFHYSPQGWEVLANNTVKALRGVLAERAALRNKGAGLQ